MSKRRTSPLRRPIDDRRGRLLRMGSFDIRSRLRLKCRGKFGRAQFGRGERLSQFQTQVPHPLGENLGKLLATRRMGIPPIGLLLLVFVGQHGFKRATMQVEIQHIRGRQRWGEEGADEKFLDHAVSLNADCGRRASSRMGSDHQAHLGSGRGQGNGWTIVERSGQATF